MAPTHTHAHARTQAGSAWGRGEEEGPAAGVGEKKPRLGDEERLCLSRVSLFTSPAAAAECHC